MISLQNMSHNMETLLILEFLIKQMPNEWFKKYSLHNNLGILLKRIADNIHQNEYKANKTDIKQIK
jgi:hypothetical protein